MNEIELKTKIEGLEKAIAEHKDFAGNFENELTRAQQELKDYNKPELTPSQMDDIYEAVENAVNEYDFSDTDNFEIEYGINYDGKVHCESHELSDSSSLIDAISEKVYRLFKEADCPEDDNSQLNTQTVAEKIL
mgnify:CR=1 FL=1